VIDALNRIRGPFNVSSAALAAGVAALGDKAHIAQAAAHNEEWLPKVGEAIAALGLAVTPSAGNFILIHFPDAPGKRAADADQFLLKRGVILRRVEAYGLKNALRMTIGSAEANRATIDGLAAFLGKGRQ
jgi:histidinol-phosphate aminotransferase